MNEKLSFWDKLAQQMKQGRHLCVGLDTEYEKLPKCVSTGLSDGEAMRAFNIDIVNNTTFYAGAYKLNLAFYLQRGENGLCALHDTLSYLQEHYPEQVVILDFKVGDIGNTNTAWADFVFRVLPGVDAITATGYVGLNAFAPLWQNYPEKGIFFLGLTSNPENKELQLQSLSMTEEMMLQSFGFACGNKVMDRECFTDLFNCNLRDYCERKNILTDYKSVNLRYYLPTVWQDMVIRVGALNRKLGSKNCGIVFGATNSTQLQDYAKLTDTATLFPGVGAQGGSVQEVVTAMKDKPFLINVSRSIIFASSGTDYAIRAGAGAKICHQLIVETKGVKS
ncbi:MAG: orotidine-5'-phosphate decarboxylase [Candidatus Komeilibacteria bacterium CG_4_10_14_0_2_um_filter_37_10]|uniref:Orotidine-5'-phosphate decarboxylase n=1 Tax=Candidatus Komeilibacteria bacterium CG_4_10_14_0_2_um_filter_37_10 TaxID=1974470 RepID=A0A2M7VGJ4_9BACT|nr:MAG: orotidine-5'-phosphate decarboxylase [Candidatus Komeilibacteria bacterium CG_4_10_14_0_2_um_filter_37_10]PJA93411.1 MAG: orotidine-5'-phosphate decarboxylase [Candidatus Komeilibacteria bacterium CG_4_9_14_3_um_filter_37_5]